MTLEKLDVNMWKWIWYCPGDLNGSTLSIKCLQETSEENIYDLTLAKKFLDKKSINHKNMYKMAFVNVKNFFFENCSLVKEKVTDWKCIWQLCA